MKNLFYSLTLVCLLSTSASAVHLNHTFDASYGANKDSFTHSLSYKPMVGFFESSAWKIGVGARYTGFIGGSGVDYERADSAYKSSNSYELTVPDARVYSLNAIFETTYTFWNKLEVGLNIDLIGYGVGTDRVGNYTSPNAGASGAATSEVPAFNLLLLGKHDKGQLNSEIFVGYRFNQNLGVRAGLSHLITEHKATTNLEGENRFRHLGYFPFASVNYTL